MSKIFKGLIVLLLVFTVSASMAQTKEVTGKVTDVDGAPVAGATVRVVGGRAGTATDANGEFKFKVLDKIQAVTVNAIGYQEQTVPITGNFLAITLVRGEGATDAGSEVVVTASGLRTKKAEIGYAATTLNNATLTQASPINVTSSLAGKVAGLQISGVNSGVNPTYSIVLRGYRSILGNNQALIVLDNVIVPNSVLGNMNPEDIADITILNGAASAALYGSLASNGAIIVTTKKGSGATSFTISQTVSAQEVSFFPKLQKKYGSGSTAYIQEYLPFENQQYGTPFDGALVEIGEYPLPGGEIQKVPYAWNDKEGKLNFWERSLTSQTDFSISSSTSKGKIYFSGQHVASNGTIEGDTYNRTGASVSGQHNFYDNLTFDYSARYMRNNYDQTTQQSAIYELILNTPGHIPLTRYKNWQTDSFAMPNYYFNAFYNNPYFLKDNYRQKVRNENMIVNAALKYSPFMWLDITGRVGMTSLNQSVKTTTGIYKFNQYAIDKTNGTYKKENINGYVEENMNYSNRLIADFITSFKKNNIENLELRLNIGAQLMQNDGKNLNASISGLALPDFYNIGNQTSPPTAEESISKSRTVGIWGEFYGIYKKFLTLHLTGRRDQVSILDPGYNSFFYPGADISFVASEAIPAIKNSRAISFLKLRAGVANVGSVNIDPYNTMPIYSQVSGYPFSGSYAYSIGNRLVQTGLKPEFTLTREVGFDLDLLDGKISTNFTAYKNNTKNQTLPVSISRATGYSTILTNTGVTSGKGIEASITFYPVRNALWELGLGGNYTYNDNKVDELGLQDLDKLRLYAYGNGTGVYAAQGMPFPALYAVPHLRDSASGKIIVDPVTGFPSADPNIKYMGNTQPKHRMGLNLNARYKQLSLRAVAEYRGGYVIYNGGASTFEFSGAGINTIAYNRGRFVIPNSVYWDAAQNKYVDNKDVTITEGGANYWPQGTVRTGITENYVTSGAFWKLREVALGYMLPTSWLQSLGFLKEVSLNLVGRNLFMLVPKTNVYTDPEYSAGGTANYVGINTLGQNPPTRYYGATLTLKF